MVLRKKDGERGREDENIEGKKGKKNLHLRLAIWAEA